MILDSLFIIEVLTKKENKMIPVLDSRRVYIYSNNVFLYLRDNKSIIVSNDGWEILKHCDGTKTIDMIFNVLNVEYEISKEDIVKFINTANSNNVVNFISDFKKNDIKIFGDNNLISPQIASVEITERCNLECIYCYGEFKRDKGVFLNIDQIKLLFDDLSKTGVMAIELTGGEPLLHPNFKEILEIAINKFEKINILSNGVLFNNETINVIRKYKNKIAIQISIDGCSEETNYKVRRVKNTFEKTLNTLERLENIGIHYQVVYMTTEENKHEIHAMFELFRQKKLKNLMISKATPFGRACDCKDCLITKNDNEVINTIVKVQKEYPDILSKRHYIQQHPGNVNNISKYSIDNCGTGWRAISIAANGDVRSCLLLGKTGNMGNVFKQNIFNILNSPKGNFYLNFSKKMDEEPCQLCSYKNYCAMCITRIYAANIQRIKDGLDLCEIAKRNKMDECFDFNPDCINFKFEI